MPRTSIFLDMDGVLVDQQQLPLEYQRLIGEALVGELGGSVEDWGRANAVAFPRWFESIAALPPDEHPLDRYDREAVLGIRGMCEVLGRPPPGEHDCRRLGRAADTHVRANHEAFIPGVSSVIRELARSHTIHFATGNPSWNVEVAMNRLGRRGEVGLLCGPDLIGVLKQSPEFYPRLFDRLGVDPAVCIVVDDSAAQLAMAARMGASTVLVGSDAPPTARADAIVPSISDLPEAIRNELPQGK